MNVKIRRATNKDAKVILGLLKEFKQGAYEEMGMKNVKIRMKSNSLDFYKQTIKRDDVVFLLAEVNRNIHGLAMGYLTPKVFDGEYRMMLEELFVKQESRQEGIGTKLLKSIETEAVNKGVRLIKLTTGTKLKANEFYMKHGYEYFENAYRKKL